MHAPLKHDKDLEFLEEVDHTLDNKTFSKQLIENKKPTLTIKDDGPKPQKILKTSYLYQILHFHLHLSKVNCKCHSQLFHQTHQNYQSAQLAKTK